MKPKSHPAFPEIKNFARLSPTLYRGAVPKSKQDLKLLKHAGVRAIVDFQARPNPLEAKWAKDLNLKYLPVPWTAHLHRALLYQYVYNTARHFLEVLADEENLPVYVHCYHGRERTGTMIAVYRIAIENWSYERARDEMLSFGVNKWLHFNLFLFLKRFARVLRE